MRIALIGASGMLGRCVIEKALEKGHTVKGFCRHCVPDRENVEFIAKSLFEMTEADIEDCDVFISAFGSGFEADPEINYEAYQQYRALNEDAGRRTVVIGGAGSLYTDSMRNTLCLEQPEYPKFLYEISKNIAKGIEELSHADFPWTIVSPPVQFDAEHPGYGEYRIIEADYVVYNKQNDSYASYRDVAAAMVEISEKSVWQKKRVVVVSEK